MGPVLWNKLYLHPARQAFLLLCRCHLLHIIHSYMMNSMYRAIEIIIRTKSRVGSNSEATDSWVLNFRFRCRPAVPNIFHRLLRTRYIKYTEMQEKLYWLKYVQLETKTVSIQAVLCTFKKNVPQFHVFK